MFVLALLAVCANAYAGSGTARPVAIEAQQVWHDPVHAFARQKSKQLPDYFQVKRFDLSRQHIVLLRQAQLAWDVTEIGAPMFDAAKPYGQVDLLAQLGAVFGERAPSRLARRHVEMMFALGALLQHGELAPGVYTPRNATSTALRQPMTEPGGALSPSASLGLTAAGAFAFKAEHRQLLKVMSFGWPERSRVSEQLDDGSFPAPTFDPKRPYGERTNYEIDMAEALGRRDLLQMNTDAGWTMSPLVTSEFQNLHRQMLFALQVFLENADIKPGPYTWAKP